MLKRRTLLLAFGILDTDGGTALARATDNDFLAFQIRRSGKTLREGKASGFSLAHGHNVKSLSKSILALLVGIALKEEIIRDLEEDVAPLLWPEKKAPKLSWRQLLTMRSGFPSTSGKGYARWVSSRDWVEYFLRQKRSSDGEFGYSTGDAHLLAAALRKKLGRPLASYAAEKLFSPLGISHVKWSHDPQGREFGGNDLSISFRAVSRIGQMLLSEGEWEGRSLVPPKWIKEMLEKQSSAPSEFVQFQVRGYGYYWWLVNLGGAEAACALGYGGQVLCLLPEQRGQITLFARIPSSGRGVIRNWTKVQAFLRNAAREIMGSNPSGKKRPSFGDESVQKLGRPSERRKALVEAQHPTVSPPQSQCLEYGVGAGINSLVGKNKLNRPFALRPRDLRE